MAKFLSDEWFEAILRIAHEVAPETPGSSARFNYHVLDGPDGDIHYKEVTVDGRPRELGRGSLPDPDFELTIRYDDWVAMRRGEGPGIKEAVQTGLIQVDGDVEHLLRFATLGEQPWHAEHARRALAVTEF